jgi:hypothetical protein
MNINFHHITNHCQDVKLVSLFDAEMAKAFHAARAKQSAATGSPI